MMCICVYVYMCICVYVYMCICVYVYMCVYVAVVIYFLLRPTTASPSGATDLGQRGNGNSLAHRRRGVWCQPPWAKPSADVTVKHCEIARVQLGFQVQHVHALRTWQV